jgi:hypothetical protein
MVISYILLNFKKIVGDLFMITDKQFDDAFTAAGGWFILTQCEEIEN